MCSYKYEKHVLPVSMIVHHAFFLLGLGGTLLIALERRRGNASQVGRLGTRETPQHIPSLSQLVSPVPPLQHLEDTGPSAEGHN